MRIQEGIQIVYVVHRPCIAAKFFRQNIGTAHLLVKYAPAGTPLVQDDAISGRLADERLHHTEEDLEEPGCVANVRSMEPYWHATLQGKNKQTFDSTTSESWMMVKVCLLFF